MVSWLQLSGVGSLEHDKGLASSSHGKLGGCGYGRAGGSQDSSRHPMGAGNGGKGEKNITGEEYRYFGIKMGLGPPVPQEEAE